MKRKEESRDDGREEGDNKKQVEGGRGEVREGRPLISCPCPPGLGG